MSAGDLWGESQHFASKHFLRSSQWCMEGATSSSRRPNKAFWFSVASGEQGLQEAQDLALNHSGNPTFSFLVLSALSLLHGLPGACMLSSVYVCVCIYICIYVYTYICMHPGLFWLELRHLAFGRLAERRIKSELGGCDKCMSVLCGTALTMSTT